MNSARVIDKKISYYKTVLVEEAGVKEEIFRLTQEFDKDRIETEIKVYNSGDEVMLSDRITIEADYYDLLMSTSDIFEEGKLENSYRNKDLWVVIDKIRNES